ncbi:MAG: hypothetical protein PHX18_03060 [Candidatus Gastranaerophilales bacterium]|nr:hypothetical protein [Candidatus Gastranaerophilales bacterium]
MTTIVGIKLENRVEGSENLQKILTKHGCSIKTRIGLHSVADNVCAPDGIIILEVINDEAAQLLGEELANIRGLILKTMVFPS